MMWYGVELCGEGKVGSGSRSGKKIKRGTIKTRSL